MSFFAQGKIGLPEGGKMDSKRFEELLHAAGRLMLLYRTGQIAYLPSAQELNLANFWENGIFTINKLLQTKERPTAITQTVWDALRKEAAAVLEYSDS